MGPVRGGFKLAAGQKGHGVACQKQRELCSYKLAWIHLEGCVAFV